MTVRSAVRRSTAPQTSRRWLYLAAAATLQLGCGVGVDSTDPQALGGSADSVSAGGRAGSGPMLRLVAGNLSSGNY